MALIYDLMETLERRILSGAIEPGDRVNENAVASEFNVSRAVVREAIRALAHGGLIRFEENRGAFVRTVSFAEVLDLYEVRAGLSRSAGRLAALNATTGQIQALLALNARMLDLCEAGDSDEYHRLNVEWHDLLFDCAANPRLKELHESISKEVSLFVKRGVVGAGNLRVSAREHAEIFEGIRRGDPEAASKAFEQHVLAGKLRMIENVARTSPSMGSNA
jgi:DNA-binding GntR family transcriptional regulator